MASENVTADKHLKIIVGPLLFVVALLLPFLGPLEARIGFGILFWMVYWWITDAVDMKVTCLVPFAVVCFYPFVDRENLLKLYMHKDLFLILGASLLTCAWAKWGLARRVALGFLSKFSNDSRTQAVGWFLLCGTVSFVMGNTPVGAIFTPIAVSALLYVGYKTHQDRFNSKAASNILIAVAWGASIGGMVTPLGGGQALVTWSFLTDYLGREVFFLDWSLRMLPVSLLVMASVALFFYYVMKPDPEELKFKGSRDFYREELKEMGPMGFEEKLCAYGFVFMILLVIFRPFYADHISGPAWEWLHPSPLFFIFATLLFFIPSVREKGETVLSLQTVRDHFPVGIVFIWPAAVALGRILNETGTSAVFAAWLQPMIDAGTVPAIIAVGAGSTFLSQFVTDTAAAGVLVPLMLDAFHNWAGLEFGAVAWVWIAGASLSWSFAIVSATGAQAIAAGFGANIRRMFVYGMGVAVLSAVVTILYFIVTVAILKLDFYMLPPGM